MYCSTRSHQEVSSSYAIVHGISEDGGLYVKTSWEKASFLSELEGKDYQAIALDVLSYFLDDFSEEELKKIITESYSGTSFPEAITKLQPLGSDELLELYHGPTFAFKDMALGLFSKLMNHAKEHIQETRNTIILSATSGDTGSAVLSGFEKDMNTKIIIFYPEGKVSDFQERQMHYFTSGNRKAIAIQGNFDDCQTLIKQAFQEIKLNHTIFSSANSINIARIIPQVIYYFYSYKELLSAKKIQYGEKINFVVPTGNFGNILAGYYAKKMGLFIDKLVVASNDNHVLTQFFHEGMYDRRRPFIQTISPSMDILISSNLERFVFEMLDENPRAVKYTMAKLKEDGFYQIDDKFQSLFEHFLAGYAKEKDVLQTMKDVYHQYHVLIDPHTAVAVKVKNDLSSKLKGKTIILSTASPYKFMDSVYEALQDPYQGGFEEKVYHLHQKYGLPLEKRVLLYQHTQVNKITWPKEKAMEYLEEMVGKMDV